MRLRTGLTVFISMMLAGGALALGDYGREDKARRDIPVALKSYFDRTCGLLVPDRVDATKALIEAGLLIPRPEGGYRATGKGREVLELRDRGHGKEAGFCAWHFDVTAVEDISPVEVKLWDAEILRHVTFRFTLRLEEWARDPVIQEAFAHQLALGHQPALSLPMRLTATGWKVGAAIL